MADKIIKGTTANWYISDGKTKRNLGTASITKQDEADQLVYAGFATWDSGSPFVLDQDLVNNIRTV